MNEERRFRWWIVTIPLTTIAALLFLRGIQPAMQFEKLLELLAINDGLRMSHLVALAIVLAALVAILRVILSKHNDQ